MSSRRRSIPRITSYNVCYTKLLRFPYAHARGADWRSCVDACVARLGAIGGGLGFVYFTEALAPHAGEIVGALRARSGVQDWVGTVGIGVLSTGTEYLEEPALAAMVADFRNNFV